MWTCEFGDFSPPSLVCPQSHSEFSRGGHFVLPVWCRAQKRLSFPGTGVKGGCELPLSGLGTEPRSFGRVASVLNPL